MPRRTSTQPVASSNSTPLKRSLPQSKAAATRQSKRIKSSPVPPASTTKSTPKKSQFFNPESETSEPESVIENEASGYEDEDESASLVSSPPESEAEDEADEDEYDSAEDRPRKRNQGRKATNGAGTPSKPTKGQELWRPGVKTGLAPGEAIFIKLPKAREAGKTPYEDDTIHPNTMEFLGDLKENNDREWLKGELALKRGPMDHTWSGD